MIKIFYLWHTQRQGWVTNIGTTSTNLAEAGKFTEEEALKRVKNGLDHDGTPSIVPVDITIYQWAIA